MLLKKRNIYELFRCPKTAQKLKRSGSLLVSVTKESYDIINGYPVLIDFDKTILDSHHIKTLSSVIERNTYERGYTKIIKNLLSIPKNITARNINYIIESIKKTDRKVLVVGGGSIGQGIESLYSSPDIKLVSFDIYGSPYVQFVADAHNIPLPNDSFDAVT